MKNTTINELYSNIQESQKLITNEINIISNSSTELKKLKILKLNKWLEYFNRIENDIINSKKLF